jgi:hypothetical protein
MNVWEARVVVRERSIAEIIDLALRFSLVLGGRLYAWLFVSLILPAYALCFLLLARGVPDVWVWILAVILFALLQLPFTVAAGRLMFSAELSMGEVLSASLRLMFRACGARFLAALLLGGGSLLVVAVPVAIARGLYLVEIVVLEGSAALAAYRRGTRLTHRRVLQTFGVWLALVATSSTFIGLAEVMSRSLTAEGLSLDALRDLWHGLSSQAGIAGLFLSLPLVATLRFLAYIDNRTRREGWDIQVRFLELGRVLEGRAT